MKNKLILSMSILIICILTSLQLFAISPALKVNGQVIPLTTPPIMQKGVTLVPLRIIGESLDATVNYDGETQQITITKDEVRIKLTLNKPEAIYNGLAKPLDVAPSLINGTTMVPLRFISENLNCTVNWDKQTQTISVTSPSTLLPIATIKIQNFGVIKAELYPHFAPNTVHNFISLAHQGFYNGLTFHRVIDDFMIQGGCPSGNGTGDPGYSIPGEFKTNGFTANTLSHTSGILSMARANLPDSAGSQFFIMTSTSPHLDGDYAAFGKVISGMEIVSQIEKTSTNLYDAPLTPIIIESISIDTKGVTYPEPIKLP